MNRSAWVAHWLIETALASLRPVSQPQAPEAGGQAQMADGVAQPRPGPIPGELPRPVDQRLLEACRGASARLEVQLLRSLGVTSALRGEGRTSIALAFSLIQAVDFGRRVTLVETDLDQPALAALLSLECGPGLAELLRGEASLAECTQTVRPNLSVVVAGHASEGKARLLAALSKQRLIESIQMSSELVVVDLPPVLDSPWGRIPADSLQKIVLVVRAGITPLRRVQAQNNCGGENRGHPVRGQVPSRSARRRPPRLPPSARNVRRRSMVRMMDRTRRPS